MIEIGHRFALRWKHPHRTEATVVELREREIIADVVHRCDPPCALLGMRATLSIEGRITFLEREFEQIYEPMAPPDALALPAPK